MTSIHILHYQHLAFQTISMEQDAQERLLPSRMMYAVLE